MNVEHVVQFTRWRVENVCISVYVGNTQNNLKNITEQHSQDVAQNVQYGKNSDTFAARLNQHFDQKPTPQ